MCPSSVTDFLATIPKEAEHFNAIRDAAEKENCRLKYVAEFDQGKAKVGLQHIPSDHPFYNLDGSDNIVLFQRILAVFTRLLPSTMILGILLQFSLG